MSTSVPNETRFVIATAPENKRRPFLMNLTIEDSLLRGQTDGGPQAVTSVPPAPSRTPLKTAVATATPPLALAAAFLGVGVSAFAAAPAVCFPRSMVFLMSFSS